MNVNQINGWFFSTYFSQQRNADFWELSSFERIYRAKHCKARVIKVWLKKLYPILKLLMWRTILKVINHMPTLSKGPTRKPHKIPSNGHYPSVESLQICRVSLKSIIPSMLGNTFIDDLWYCMMISSGFPSPYVSKHKPSASLPASPKKQLSSDQTRLTPFM